MSHGGGEPIYSNGGRRTAETPYEHETLYDFLEDFAQAGVAQIGTLASPMHFVLALTPVYIAVIATGATTSIVLLAA